MLNHFRPRYSVYVRLWPRRRPVHVRRAKVPAGTGPWPGGSGGGGGGGGVAAGTRKGER